VAAHAAVVIDGASAEILFDKDAHKPLPPASLTKIMTAILTIERIPTETDVEVDVDSRKMTGSSVMGLVPGDHYTVYNLLYGLMLPSGNDAALALARAVSGSDAAFVAEMNGFAKSLGLRDTHFVNPHGLSSRQQYASAYDLAILARFGMSLPTFSDIVSTPGALIAGSRPMALYNGNSFLRAYPGADGVKIGFTESAGFTLVASATHNGHRLYAVVLNTTQRDADAGALLDWAFANYTWSE
jgi:D-alanyl-D-alanine carboxypeptidase (penicillin-binding protein 5/6)